MRGAAGAGATEVTVRIFATSKGVSVSAAASGRAARKQRSEKPVEQALRRRINFLSDLKSAHYSFTHRMNGRRHRPVTAVTIAASDSGGGAGIQADLLTFAAHGVYGATIITAATAQNTVGITGVEPLSAGLLRKQIDAVFPDLKPAAVKIGALYDAARIREVAAGLKRHRAANV